MQSLLLPAPWFSNTHFGQPRFEVDPGRVSIHLRPSIGGLKSGLRNSPPSFLMSGPPPTDNPTESVRNIQRQPSQGSGVVSTGEAVDPIVTPSVPVSRSPGAQDVRTTQTQRFFPPPDVRHGLQTQAQSAGLTAGIPVAPSETTQLQSATATTTARPLPPRSTRRAKAHVASACVNCKRKHLGCDSARPCRRCVLAGKAVSVAEPFSLMLGGGLMDLMSIQGNLRGCHPQKARPTAFKGGRGSVKTIRSSRRASTTKRVVAGNCIQPAPWSRTNVFS
jgi:hypothetical protein